MPSCCSRGRYPFWWCLVEGRVGVLDAEAFEGSCRLAPFYGHRRDHHCNHRRRRRRRCRRRRRRRHTGTDVGSRAFVLHLGVDLSVKLPRNTLTVHSSTVCTSVD